MASLDSNTAVRERAADELDTSAREWLSWVCAGGRLADRGMEALVRRVGPRIKAFIRGHRLADDRVDDLFQETFIKVYRAAAQFKGDSRVSVWICSIARNCVLGHLRGTGAREALNIALEDDPDDEQSGASGAERAELMERSQAPGSSDLDDCVDRGFATFGARYPDRAQALQLSAVEEWTIEEMAAYLGRTLQATRQYLFECRKKLQPFLAPCRESVSG